MGFVNRRAAKQQRVARFESNRWLPEDRGKVDDATVRGKLLRDYKLEIGGGLGDFKGRAWRIGLIGASATPRHVSLCLEAHGHSLS